MKKKRVKILVTGTRGIPGIQGGIETHCEELYPRLAKRGFHITLTRRIPYVRNLNDPRDAYMGVQLIDLPAPRSKGFEAIIHTIISTLYAKIHGFTCIHIHGIGPSLCGVLARLLGLKVVVTNHGPDYKRQKWGKISRFILRLGEFTGMIAGHRVIAVSRSITKRLTTMYGRKDIIFIPNGVVIQKRGTDEGFLKQWGLQKNEYLLAVGRFVPEKGFHDLIESYGGMELKDIPLVIAGDADHETAYSRNLKRLAAEYGCILPGFIPRPTLAQLYSHARLFILPSYHEGLPLALLEALSFNADVLVSNIPAHREFGLDKDSYFSPGNRHDMRIKIGNKLKTPLSGKNRRKLLAPYQWDVIADKTAHVYEGLLSPGNRERETGFL